MTRTRTARRAVLAATIAAALALAYLLSTAGASTDQQAPGISPPRPGEVEQAAGSRQTTPAVKTAERVPALPAAGEMEATSASAPESERAGADAADEDHDSVMLMQQRLIHLGWNITADGIHGPATSRALRQFQATSGLAPTGRVNDETLAALEDADAATRLQWQEIRSQEPAETPEGTDPARDPTTTAERIADATGFDWRSHGATFRIGCSAYQDPCSSGSYEYESRIIHIHQDTARDPELLREVVIHELAHVWQFNVRGWPQAAYDLDAWGLSGIEGLEKAADCIATIWGVDPAHTHYWACPEDALAHMRSILQQ